MGSVRCLWTRLTRDNNTLHTEPRAARVFLLASLSPRPGERCRYPTQSDTELNMQIAKAAVLFLGLIFFVSLVVGCDPFPDPPTEITENPTPNQIRYCRRIMYIDPGVTITPLGYFHDHNFLDDVIGFKFIAQTDQYGDLFESGQVTVNELLPNYSIGSLPDNPDVEWWPSDSTSLIGGNFRVPSPNSAEQLSVGIEDNGDGTLTVYVVFFEA